MPILHKRYTFFAGSFLIALLLYIDRACISSAKESIVDDLNLTDTQMGWVLSAFALGYALFQVPSGALGDRYGVRKVMTAIITIWSIFTMLTGFVWNYMSILIFRFIFGAGEAGAFPNISRAAFSWVPLKERGIFQGINFSGSRLGAAFALPLVAYLIEAWGWRMIFYFFGMIGILFAILFYVFFRNRPEEHPHLSDQEKAYILKNRQQEEENKSSISGKQMMTSKNVLLVMGQYIGSNFIFFFTLTWLFPYIKQTYQLNLIDAGFYASIPLIAGALGAVLCLSIAIFGSDMTLSPSWAFCMDIGGKHSGKVSGVMNMAGNIGAFATGLAFPYLQKWTGSDNSFFYVAALLAGIAIVFWLFMDPQKKVNHG